MVIQVAAHAHAVKYGGVVSCSSPWPHFRCKDEHERGMHFDVPVLSAPQDKQENQGLPARSDHTAELWDQEDF